jgi:alkylhydroperoxidase family enzyme
MSERYQAYMERLIDAAVNTAGDTNSSLRRKIIDRATGRQANPNGILETLPPELAEFADKVASNAAGITDRDIDVLRDAGYSDDAILEIMNCAALAEGIGRLKVVRAAMESE